MCKFVLNKILNGFRKDFKTIYDFEHLCPVCGSVLEIAYCAPICKELSSDWKLTDGQRRAFDFREGCLCKNCNSNARSRNMAKAILESLNLKTGQNLQFLKDLTAQNCGLKIAEINGCGSLHRYLSVLPDLAYSEYKSQIPEVKSEDLMNLSYETGSFDVVIMSDVLEHVPDYGRALREIRRILKKDGVFIFTVPFLTDRPTKKRAKLGKNEEIVHICKESYHGLYSQKVPDYIVFYEFGYDFVLHLASVFKTGIYSTNNYGGIIASTFICMPRPIKFSYFCRNC